MSHSRNRGRDLTTQNRSGSAMQSERERDKKRREQQLIKHEQPAEEPFFSQPRKVTTARQDSLSRNINNVLGDPDTVQKLLFREPNIWLGTSRGPATPAPPQPQDEPPLFPASSKSSSVPTSQQKSYSSSQKRGPPVPPNSVYHQTQSSKNPQTALTSGQMHRNHGYNKSSREESSQQYPGQAKQSQNSYGRNRHMQDHIQSAYPQGIGKNNKRDSSNKPGDASFSSNDLPISRRDTMLHTDPLDHDKPVSKGDLPGRIPDRDRVPSVDSDLLGGVENILKEMVELPMEPLTEIKTPNVGENKFNFSSTKRKIAGPESSLESSNADGVEGMAGSDSDSSEDESSDDEDDAPNITVTNTSNNPNKWNLSSFTAPQTANPLITNDTTPENGSSGKNKSPEAPGSTDTKRTDQRTKASSRNGTQMPPHSSPSVGHSMARGRKSDKQPSKKSYDRPRSSSSSSQRSASSGHRSTSSGKRSVSAHRGNTPGGQSRQSMSHLNNTDPDVNNSKKESRNSKSKIVDKKGSGGHSPPGLHSNTSRSPKNLNLVNANLRIQTSPRGHTPEPSGVSKQTLSSTNPGNDPKGRHSVGRKGPRVSDNRAQTNSLTSKPNLKSSSTGLSECSSSSDSESSDDEMDATMKNSNPTQPVTSPATAEKARAASDSDSASDSSSDSDSDSSSSSDSESENRLKHNEKNPNKSAFKAPDTQSSRSWNLGDIVPKTEPKTAKNIPSRSPNFGPGAQDSKIAKQNHSSPYCVSNNPSAFSPKSDQRSCNPVTQYAKDKGQSKSRSVKKANRKSAPGSLTPNLNIKQAPPGTMPNSRQVKADMGNMSSKSHNTSWSGKSASTAPDNADLKKSSVIAKKGRASSTSSEKSTRRHPSPHGVDHFQNEYTNNSNPNALRKSVPPETERALTLKENFEKPYPALWVRIKASLLGEDLHPVSQTSNPNKRSRDLAKPESATPPKAGKPSKSPELKYNSQKRSLTTVSTGSETEKPSRRAECVQVAIATPSTDRSADAHGQANKRKNCSEHAYNEVPPQSAPGSRKRRKRDKSSPRQSQTSPKSNSSSPWLQEHSQQNKSSPAERWQDPVTVEEASDNISKNNRNTCHFNNRTPNTRTTPRQESPTSNNNPTSQPPLHSATAVVLPDSSVPEQESIKTSDYYMREGKKMKHEGDGLADTRTGRTRPGEALNRALAYFEASLFFIMSGHVMEAESVAERSETCSNSGSSSTTHCPSNMYQQTVHLLDFILKMRPHVEQEDRVFKRIMISCIRCQAILYFRIFKLKKDIAVKNSELLTEQFKTMSKSNRTPSPWHHNANAAPNVSSPVSPAVPSPFGHPGPSPVSSNGEQVSSSTQAGKMTPPSHGGLVFPQKMYDMYRQHHAIMCNLLQAHEKWDLGETMLEGHNDFFRNIDTLCSRTLTFHTSLRDVFLYHKVVLHQLKTLTSNSPRE